MSTILDALRRGRSAPPPGPNPNAAQTDAVLQTLGYGRFNPTAPLNRLKRVLVLLELGVVLAVALWIGVIWLTHAYVARIQDEVASPPAIAVKQSPTLAPPAPVAPTTVVSTPAPSVPAPPPPSSSAASTSERATSPASTAAVDSRAPVAPISPPITIHASQRAAAPHAEAAAQRQASAHTAKPTTAGASGVTVTVGDDYFRRAMMYQRLGDFENALINYRQVLQRDDLNVEAHNNLGLLYRDKGLFEDAIQHFQRAIAINPAYARARNNLGVVYLNQRKLETAATQFQAALAIDPKNVESLVNLSTVEKESGRRDQARAWLTRALDADPRNAEGHYNLGLLEDEAGNRAQAVAHYRAFLQYGAANHASLVGDVRARLQKLDAESKN